MLGLAAQCAEFMSTFNPPLTEEEKCPKYLLSRTLTITLPQSERLRIAPLFGRRDSAADSNDSTVQRLLADLKIRAGWTSRKCMHF